VRAIATTGFLVAFGNRKDHHRWAAEIAGPFTEPVLTCEAALAETAFHLASSSLSNSYAKVCFGLRSLPVNACHG
jgi:hypothetical protein